MPRGATGRRKLGAAPVDASRAEPAAPPSPAPPARYAVTTRSHLRSPRLFFSMLRANRRIERQLAATPGSLRFASVIAGPREFWTLSLWRSRDEMLEFMRSGPHEELMWNISRWFDSFWLMRWSPTEEEEGGWEGLQLAAPPPAERPGDEPGVAAQVLGTIPNLLKAVGPDGRPSFDHAPHVRRSRRRVEGGVAAMLRIPVRCRWQVPLAWRDLRRLQRSVAEEGALRAALGAGRRRELVAVVVCGGEEVWRRCRECAAVREVLERWPGSWLMRWDAESEFGHWDGFRLRHVRARRT